MSSLVASLSRARPAFILWRYVVRQLGPPTAIGFLVFTFLMLMRFLLEISLLWIQYGAELSTVLWAILYSLPHVIAITLPMGVLVGGLIAFGRMSADFEIVALRALGISLMNLVPPVLIFSGLMWALNSWIFLIAMPWGNANLRELQWDTITQRAFSSEVKPRVFHQDFPGLVLYIEDVVEQGSEWHGVFAAQTSTDPPTIIRAERAYPFIDEDARETFLLLENGTVVASATDPREVTITTFERQSLLVWSEDENSVIGDIGKDGRSMTLEELRVAISDRQAVGDPAFDLQVEVHKKFAFPFACLIMGLISLPLGISTQRQTTAVGFGIGTGVILVYYFFAQNGEQQGDVGNITPWIGMWIGNIVVGTAAAFLLWKKARERDFGISYRLRPWWDRATAGVSSFVRTRLLHLRRRTGTRRRHRGDFPRLLDRHVLRSYASLYVLAYVALVVVWTVVEWLDKASYVSNPEFIPQFFQFRVFEIMFDVVPIAAVITVLATFSLMTKNNEVTAAMAGGVSLYRLTAPVLLPAIALSLMQYAMQDYVLPLTSKQAEAVEEQMHPSGASRAVQQEQTWVFSEGKRVFHFSDYVNQPPEFRGLRVYYLTDASGGIARMEYANQATWNQDVGRWEGHDGWRRFFVLTPSRTGMRPTELEEFRFSPLPIAEPPAYFDQSPRTPDEMSTVELAEHIRVLRERGYETHRARVDFHYKLAWPMVTFVMTLVGVPFAFRMGRHGALTGVAVAIGLVILYWIIFGVFRALGYAATLPPPLAAWAPHLLFLALAAHQALGLRT